MKKKLNNIYKYWFKFGIGFRVRIGSIELDERIHKGEREREREVKVKRLFAFNNFKNSFSEREHHEEKSRCI
jgi:hypothetical protein